MSNAHTVASEVRRYVEIAVSEMGYDQFMQEEYSEKIKSARKRGVRDIGGWLADVLWNDPDTVGDLAGDRMYDVMNQYGMDPSNREDWEAVVAAFEGMVPHVAGKMDLGFIG